MEGGALLLAESAGVGCRGPVLDLPVGERGQFGEDLAQVSIGVDALASAVFDDGVEDGSALARIACQW